MKLAAGTVALALAIGSTLALPVPDDRQDGAGAGAGAAIARGLGSEEAHEPRDMFVAARDLLVGSGGSGGAASPMQRKRGGCGSCLRPKVEYPGRMRPDPLLTAGPAIHPSPNTAPRLPNMALHQQAAAAAAAAAARPVRPANFHAYGGIAGVPTSGTHATSASTRLGAEPPPSTPLLASPPRNPYEYAPPGAQPRPNYHPGYRSGSVSPPQDSSAGSTRPGSPRTRKRGLCNSCLGRSDGLRGVPKPYVAKPSPSEYEGQALLKPEVMRYHDVHWTKPNTKARWVAGLPKPGSSSSKPGSPSSPGKHGGHAGAGPSRPAGGPHAHGPK